MTQILPYKNIFLQLLPQGAVWQHDDVYINIFADALGDELDALYRKFQQFKSNLSPQNVTDLLPEWERDTGIPDPCLGIAASPALRKRNLLLRLYERKDVTLAWLNQFLQQFQSEAYAQESGAATLLIYYPIESVEYAHVGFVRVGERLLSTVQDEYLTCHLENNLPAHLTISFRDSASTDDDSVLDDT